MEPVDPILPVGPQLGSDGFMVEAAQTAGDGSAGRRDPKQKEEPIPHDSLELHDEELDPIFLFHEPKEPENGLDIAV